VLQTLSICLSLVKENNLDIFPYGYIFDFIMARAATTSDAFNAVAEPRRREILLLLADREHSVNEIVAELRVDQPSVSKHLRVLRDVGLVRMRCNGRQKLYQTNAEGIRPLHEWASEFERYWSHQLNRVKERAEKLAAARRMTEPGKTPYTKEDQ
jgi:DNA-binding transcriptional ArsR family regulator